MMRKLALAFGIVLATGCGSSAPSGGGVAQDTAAVQDTGDAGLLPDAGSGDGAGDAGPDATVDTAAAPDVPAAEAVARNPACGKFDDGEYGKKIPWTGFQHGGKSYTCNTCRGGYPIDQGLWRFIDFDTEDPTTPLKDDYKETLVFDGNTWVLHLKGLDVGKQTEAVVEGWFWCADSAELLSQNAVFVVTKVSPEGAFGWDTGLVFTGNLKHAGDDMLAWGFHAGFEKDWIGEALYCRVGTQVNGKACKDPFAN